MELSILEKITLIALDDNSGKWATDSVRLNIALAGALLYQLSKEERVELKDDRVKLINGNITSDRLVNDAIEIVKDKDNKKAIYIINRFSSLTKKYRDEIVENLMTKGILKKAEGKILWIFPTTHYPMINSKYENQIKAKLVEIVQSNNHSADDEYLFLLCIISSCDLEKEVFGNDINKKEIRNKIKKISEKNAAGNATSKAIMQMQASVMMAATASVTASASIGS